MSRLDHGEKKRCKQKFFPNEKDFMSVSRSTVTFKKKTNAINYLCLNTDRKTNGREGRRGRREREKS